MNFQQFKRINNVVGWAVLAFAAMVYVMTMEPTASLWDCGEFIASCYKMQVVHPPGAPMFLMIGRMFSLLAMGDPMNVAWALNLMSALCSAFSMLFLFWIITHLSRKLLTKTSEEDMPIANVIAIIGAGVIGAMAGTFADSIWFSAVEGEVYSMSLLCTSIVFWAILKWEERADEPYADRWLLFIAFVMGCSIFVHWLNLLSIPALTFMYYFKRFKPTRKGMLATLGIAIVLLGLIYRGVITVLVDIAASMELFLVNSIGLPFNSGVILFLLLLVGGMAFSLWFTYKNKMPLVHNAILALMFILMGYSTIITAVIRSNADPNIDMNNPDDIVNLAAYLKREQYGSRPFLFGNDYMAKVDDVKVLGKKYQKGKDKYDIVGDKIDYVYKGKNWLFPRLWSRDHKKDYERWLGKKSTKRLTYGDNLTFFLKYQIGHMYVRYFMWNFVGRQNDEQGIGDSKNGNWLSGISFLDAIRLGPQTNLPRQVSDHPSRNTYFFLPFLLGLLGLIFHFTNDKRRAFVILLLFFFTGMAIIIQGNSPPIEPRERDYIFAGSFWAFTIWLGLGVIALYDILKTYIPAKTAALGTLALTAGIPILMGFQNWDDHDRSGRYAARDFATNYLNSCAPNSIVFTQGDNDTYPLWYAQEVENVRRDVRVVNLSLLGVDWYINQLRRKVNDADPVPMTLTPSKIRGTKRDLVPIVENPNIVKDGQFISLKQGMEFISDDSQQSKLPNTSLDTDYLPTNRLKMPVNMAAINKQKAIAPDDMELIVPEIQWEIPEKKSSLYKNDLMVLDIILANNWERPVYFAISVSPNSYLGLEKYFQLEGMTYRIVPIEAPKDRIYTGRPRTDLMYSNLMEQFKFGNIEQEGIHIDTDLRRMILNIRGNYARLADALIAKGENDKAVNILDRSITMMPDHTVPFDIYMYSTIEGYYAAGAYEKANKVTELVSDRLIEELKYIKGLKGKRVAAYRRDRQANEQFVRMFIETARKKKQDEFADKLEAKLKEVI